MRIIFWGTPEYSVKSLEELICSKHKVLAVVSQPDKKRSRGNKLIPSPVKEYAMKEDIPVYTPEKIKGNTSFINELKKLSCDLFIVIAYGKILPKEILEIPKYDSWNAHASLLPRWRGAAPIQWALIEGDKNTGVGIMKMEEGLDTGDILIEKIIKVETNENLTTLSKKLSNLSAHLLIKAIDEIEKNYYHNIPFLLKKQESLDREIKYARMIDKSDFKVDWENNSYNIYKKINGLHPRSFTKFKGKNLKLLNIRILSIDEINNLKNIILNKNLKPGTIIGIIDNEGVIISTKTEPIILLEAKLEGKNVSIKNQLIQQLKPKIGEQFSD